MLRRAILTAFVVLAGFGLLGSWIFSVFGITTEAFRITGGIILFGIGLEMLQARRSRTRSTREEEEESRAVDDVGVVPLGIPLLAGPGAITTVLTLLAQARTPAAQATVYGVIVAVLLAAWLLLHVAPAVARKLRLTGMHAIERVMGLIVMVIGVQFVIDGVQEVVVQTAARVGRMRTVLIYQRR
ncbi:MAG TPA: MarC family protein [Longimicrobium sp.]|nr:MarC family protein [Longimicrobium sp.]